MAGRLRPAASGLSDYGTSAAGRGPERALARPTSGVSGSVAGRAGGGAGSVAAGSARQAGGRRAGSGRGGSVGDGLFEDRCHAGTGPPCLRPWFVAGDGRGGTAEFILGAVAREEIAGVVFI